MLISHVYRRLHFFLSSVLGLITCLQIPSAHAYPIDQEIYYHGGPLKFEILVPTAWYRSDIYLLTDSGSFFLANSWQTGTVINLADPAAIGLDRGDEFNLGIHVLNTGQVFVMGPGSSNPDGIAHARVRYYDDVVLIQFEDLFGGGDLDFDDARIRVLGDIGFAQIPEPSSLILIASGFAALWFGRRRSHRRPD